MQTPKIQVVIRKRPLNQKQLQHKQSDIVFTYQDTIVIRQPKIKLDLTKYIDEHTFYFDGVINENVSTKSMYQQYVRPIVKHAFLGNKATVFAFGQTGSGKTFTMNGYSRKGVTGVYEFAGMDIFQSINCFDFEHYSVSCAFYEIYCGKIFDLLNDRTELRVLEDKKNVIQVSGGTRVPLVTCQELMMQIKRGMNLRITSKNGTNNESSRSHAILSIQINSGKHVGEISFIDLAGCQRGADTIDQNKQTKVDGAEINKSLLALKQCIRAMDMNRKHTPFRGSKLTMLLRDSFGDTCKTLMIGNISPGCYSCENTLNTLRYCDTVKELKSTKEKLGKNDMMMRELMLTRNKKNIMSLSTVKMEEESEKSYFSNQNVPVYDQPSKQPTKRGVTKENNINFKNIQNIVNNFPFFPNKQSMNAGDFQAETGDFSPLTPHQYQDWQHSIQLIQNWDIQTEEFFPYQQLAISTKQYLQRQLHSYFSLSRQIIQQQSKLNQQRLDLLGSAYQATNDSNEQMFRRCQVLSKLNQGKVSLITQQQNKLREYMRHLELQEECERKVGEAQLAYEARGRKNDDEISMIDEIQSEWGDELNSCDSFENVGFEGAGGRVGGNGNGVGGGNWNRMVTRQSVSMQRNYGNFGVVKSCEYRPC